MRKMRFSCTEPDKPDFEHNIYECTKCRITQSFVTPVFGLAALAVFGGGFLWGIADCHY